MAEIKTGWLKDYNGEKFAPITDARQVYFNGTKDENVQEVLSKKPGRLVEGEIYGDSTIIGSGAEIFNNLTNNFAVGNYSHAEGNYTLAVGDISHAEGELTEANGKYSHAEGHITYAYGKGSHTEGTGTYAGSEYQHVQGKNNVVDSANKYAHIVGNGITGASNAHTLDWGGNAWFSGDVYIKSTSGTNKDSGSKKLATEEFVNNNKTNIVIREW